MAARSYARARGWARDAAEDPTLVVLAVTIVVVFAGFSISRSDFLSIENVRNIGQQTAVIAVISVAMTLVILGRGLDISPGSTVALTGVLGALMLQDGVSTPIALVAVVLAGAGVGLVNGILIGGFGVSPFMATLATLAAARGAALLLAGDSGVAVDDGAVAWFGAGLIGPVPVSVYTTPGVVKPRNASQSERLKASMNAAAVCVRSVPVVAMAASCRRTVPVRLHPWCEVIAGFGPGGSRG